MRRSINSAGKSSVPGRLDVDTRSNYINERTKVGELGQVVFDVGSTNSDDRFDTARGDPPGICAIVTGYKEFIHRQLWEVVGNDVPAATTVMPELISCKRSEDVGKIDQEPILW